MIIAGKKRNNEGFTKGTWDARELELNFAAKINVMFQCNHDLDGFDINQDLVSLLNNTFDKALNESLDEMKLVLDECDDAVVEVQVDVKDSCLSDITGE